MKLLNCIGFVYFLSLFFFCSCQSIEIKLPVAELKSPEVIKEQVQQISFSAEPTKTLTVTEDANQRPLNITNQVTDSSVLGAQFNYGYADHLVIGAGLNSASGLLVQTQYQFLDDVVDDMGWSSAVQLSLNYNSISKKGSSSNLLGPGTYSYSGSMRAFGFNPGITAGYRFNKYFMSYAGVSYATISTATSITQDPSTDGNDPGKSFSQDKMGSSQSIGIGVQVDYNRIHLKPVFQWTEIDIAGQKKNSVLTSVTISFND